MLTRGGIVEIDGVVEDFDGVVVQEVGVDGALVGGDVGSLEGDGADGVDVREAGGMELVGLKEGCAGHFYVVDSVIFWVGECELG